MWSAFCAFFFVIPAVVLAESEPTKQNFITTEAGRKWLEVLMKQEGFKNDEDVEKVTLMELSPFDPPGVNFGSNRTRVDVTLLLKSCQTVNKSIIVVSLPDSVERKQQLTASGLFLTDINVYEKILPKMNEFLFNHTDYQKGMWTKSIHLKPPVRLVLKNVENDGYKRKNKREGLNMLHCKAAVTDLAKFHALSAVLELEGGINAKQDFNLSLAQRNAEKIGDWYGKVFTEFAKSIRAAWGPEWESTAQQIDEKAKTVTEDYLKVLKRNDSQFNALLNGAFSITNLFFNYGCSEDEGSPKSTKVLNFQNAFWNSPALDLQLFLNTSPEPEIITDDSRRDEIVTHYATRLKAYLHLYGYQGDVTLEDVKSEMRRTELAGFCSAVNSLSGIYLRPEDSAYTEQFIIEALKNKEIRIDSKGMILPRFIGVMKKLVKRAQNLGII
ncbi:hypothetical protein GE061_017254 [Apolygus lucorum]|uniref:CHK kinase-like domain-containing protein n=1 Tax=Apolygus lucorum TaxID=248454 RepID=A0A8S9XBU0_APOLU|nr:hypothetical protein GE061_017254 [Apolygus lucorum]